MANALKNENSPYLLQHAENPVNWYPWCKSALDKAKEEDKPIFLSVGYAACHWCHVMEKESFEDDITASIMNKHFINIKVDREERPDIDTIYMQAVVAMTGQGGWPMSVFLTPDGKPFYGGTYYPPVRRYNISSFKEILLTISRLWRDDRNQLLQSSQKISAYLFDQVNSGLVQGNFDDESLEKAAQVLAKAYDWNFGGWGQAPKFPQPMVIEFLLRKGIRGDEDAVRMATHALASMAKGGIYDVVGGGFARYSVDERWHTPHFEKMLYDNAQLAMVYLHAFLITREDKFRRVCEETLDFVLREMTHEMGGFFSSLDADSEGEEGKFYVWTPDEIQVILPDSRDATLVLAAYGITKNGNFEGTNILQRVLNDKQLAEEFGIPEHDIPEKLAKLHEQLLSARSARIRPRTDDKVLVFWNSMMMMAFAEAGRYLRRVDYAQVAIENAGFLIKHLHQEDRLLRSWRDGQAKYNAYLEDFAGLTLALLSLYQTDPDPKWYQFALKLGDEIVAHFSDPDGGFFDTRDDHEILILRPKDLQDNATPSGNALAVTALLQLAAYGDRSHFLDFVSIAFESISQQLPRYPTAFAQWLCAADFYLSQTNEIVILGNLKDQVTLDMRDNLWRKYRPNLVAAISDYPPNPNAPAITQNHTLLNNQPTAFVCRNFSCQFPVNAASEFSKQLDPE